MGEGADNTGRAQDRNAANNAEPFIHGLLGQFQAFWHKDFYQKIHVCPVPG